MGERPLFCIIKSYDNVLECEVHPLVRGKALPRTCEASKKCNSPLEQSLHRVDPGGHEEDSLWGASDATTLCNGIPGINRKHPPIPRAREPMNPQQR